MKWAGITASVVVTIGLIIGVGFLITMLHPANNIQKMEDDDDDDHDDWRRKQAEAGGEVGGEDVGKFKKQEIKNENHGALEVHMFELNEETEGGKTGKSGLGEALVITLVVIGVITAFCTISACAAILWKCGLCPERRRRRRSSSRSSSGGSGRKRTHGDIELGELRLKMRRLEKKAVSEEEDKEKREQEMEKREQEMEKRKEKQERKEKELNTDMEEVPRAGQRAITAEVSCVPELDELPTVSMEEYSRRLENATKTLQEIETARRVLENHQDNIRRGATLGFIAGVGGAGGAGGR